MELTQTPANNTIPKFLFGGGEMSKLIAAHDWSTTAIGTIDTWPVTLRTVLNTILRSRFPMFLWWGNDLIQFYNDAYRPLMGSDGKHPTALGQKGEECWTEIWPEISPLINNVIVENESVWSENQLLSIYRNGRLEDVYWTFSYSPVNDEDGNVCGVLVVCNETTQQINTINKIKQSEERFQNLIREATVGIVVLTGEEMRVEIVNAMYGRLINHTPEELLGRPLFDIIPEAADPFRAILDNVRLTGEPVYLYDQPYFVLVNGEKKEGFLNLVYQPYREANGNIVGVMALCHDVTEQVRARHRIEESELFSKSIIKNSEAAQIVWLGEDMVFDLVNEKMLEILGRDISIIGKPFMEAVPELRDTPLLERLRRVLHTGEAYYQPEEMFVIMRNGMPHTGYYNYSYAPLSDAQGHNYGIICTATEVTEQVLIRQKIEQAEAKARLAIASAALGTYEIDYATDEMLTSERFDEIWGIEHGLSRTEIVNRIHPDDVPGRKLAHEESLKTGDLDYEARIIRKDKSEHWVKVKGKVLYGEKGNPTTLLGVIQDINEQKLFAQRLTFLVQENIRELQQKNEALQESEEKYHKMVLEVEDYAILFLDRNGIVQNWNKGAERIKGYKEEEIVGKSFKTFYLPEDMERGLPDSLIAKAAKEGKAVQEGLRRRKDGSTFWGSIVITALHDSDDNVIGFSKVTRDLTERKLAEDRIQKYSADLEFQNEELKQFAFIASHDMKEPLRKIIYNNNYLYDQVNDRLNEKETQALSRSTDAAKRMQTLINDILSYSQTAFADHVTETVDLNVILTEAVANLKETIEETGATITRQSPLPVITGITHQLAQLFDNLINNAIKYRHADRRPHITITSQKVNGSDVNETAGNFEYHKISIIDNGIGFEPEYAEKIFDLFYRLKVKKDHTGSGIGLAICKRIVQNHKGFMEAHSEAGEGATFDIYLPVSAV